MKVQYQVLGKYRIEKELARGGMGVISLAYDTICERYVAIKQIRPEVKKQKGAVKRFLEEARITASLTHPNIVGVFDICERGVDSYYTMPYLQGTSLRHKLLQARSNPEAFCISHALPIFLSVAHAIEYAHNRQVIHRDIKADNIWLLAEEETVILDWGVAKRLDQYSDQIEIEPEPARDVKQQQEDHLPSVLLSNSRKPYQSDQVLSLDSPSPLISNFDHKPSVSSVVGTLNYMAPERIMREKACYTTDVYSLGVLLYFLITLQLPFLRKSFRQSRATLHKERYIPPHRKAPSRTIPWALVEIINKAVSKNVDQRYSSVKELILDLKDFQEHRSAWRQHKVFSPSNESDWLEKAWEKLPCQFLNQQGEARHLGYATRMQAPFSLNGHFSVKYSFQCDTDARGIMFHFDPSALLHEPSTIERLYLSKNHQSDSQHLASMRKKRYRAWMEKFKQHLIKTWQPQSSPTMVYQRSDIASGPMSVGINDGMSGGIAIWISGRKEFPGALIRDGVTILSLPAFSLSPKQMHCLRITNNDHTLTIHFDDLPAVTYVSPVPLVSMPFALWVLPGHFSDFTCEAFGGQLRLEGSCLDLPDYLFAKGRYSEAIEHYENIRCAFSDYQEGRWATYRCALAWLALAQTHTALEQDRVLEQACSYFDALQHTPSAPLQWLGKSLVYRFQGELEDEARALEMAYLRSDTNPLLSKIDEEIIYRLQQSVEYQPKFALQLMLCICRSRRELLLRKEILALFSKSVKCLPKTYIWWDLSLEPVNVNSVEKPFVPTEVEVLEIALCIAFFLDNPRVLGSIFDTTIQEAKEPLPPKRLGNVWLKVLMSLQEMDAQDIAVSFWNSSKHLLLDKEVQIVAYQLAYPCGTFYLQKRFLLTPLESILWTSSLSKAVSSGHVEVYNLCETVELDLMESSLRTVSHDFNDQIAGIQVSLSAHLLFDNEARARKLVSEHYDVLSLDFRAFVNAIFADRQQLHKKASKYIEGLYFLEEAKDYFVLWAQLMLLVSPGDTIKQSPRFLMDAQKVTCHLDRFIKSEIAYSQSRFVTLLALTEKWMPGRMINIKHSHPGVFTTLKQLQGTRRLRSL